MFQVLCVLCCFVPFQSRFSFLTLHSGGLCCFSSFSVALDTFSMFCRLSLFSDCCEFRKFFHCSFRLTCDSY